MPNVNYEELYNDLKKDLIKRYAEIKNREDKNTYDIQQKQDYMWVIKHLESLHRKHEIMSMQKTGCYSYYHQKMSKLKNS